MKNFYRTSLLVVCLTACRTPMGSSLSEESPASKFRTDFDWGRVTTAGIATPERILTFCFDKSVPEAFRLPFIAAASKVNAAGVGVYERWQLLTFGPAPYLCGSEWSPRPNPTSNQAKIRIKADASFGVPPKVGFEPYKIDFESMIDASSSQTAQFIVPTSNASKGHRLASFTFQRSEDFPGYIFAGEISINYQPPTKDEDQERLEWSANFGDDAANLSFDPMLLALHMFGHAIRLEHDESLYSGTQKLACGSQQKDSIDKTALVSSDGNKLEVTPLGDDVLGADQMSIEIGGNGIVETSKIIPIMFPFMRLGAHCRNPNANAKENLNDRFYFTEKETEAIKASAKHQISPEQQSN